MWYVFDYTPLGRRLLFVGRGREVARLNGIAVDRVRLGALVTSGVLSRRRRHSLRRRAGLGRSLFGLNFLLPAFAAAFLGATTILPAASIPGGPIVAVYFLATGITGLSMLGIPLWVTNVFNGGALILAVTISQLTRGREASDIVDRANAALIAAKPRGRPFPLGLHFRSMVSGNLPLASSGGTSRTSRDVQRRSEMPSKSRHEVGQSQPVRPPLFRNLSLRESASPVRQ